MKVTHCHAVTTVYAACGVYNCLAVSHPDGFRGADPHAGSASGAVVTQNLDSMKVMCLLLAHGAEKKISSSNKVELPLADWMCNASEFFWMLGKPKPAPNPNSRTNSSAVE